MLGVTFSMTVDKTEMTVALASLSQHLAVVTENSTSIDIKSRDAVCNDTYCTLLHCPYHLTLLLGSKGQLDLQPQPSPYEALCSIRKKPSTYVSLDKTE